MAINKIILPVILIVSGAIMLHGCSEYRRGDLYYSDITGDSLKYVVVNTGKGTSVLDKAKELEAEQKNRNNEVNVLVVNDSSKVTDAKAVLLVHTEMPDFENDMLSKGYMGGFGSRLVSQYVVISYDDFSTYFKKYPDK
jgi:hypothetical protein